MLKRQAVHQLVIFVPSRCLSEGVKALLNGPA